ncbi:MAG TPA: M23 family metallopeptidase [Methylomirabilota bacterium]|nr:M23 family metallopeptidase [Methylomirabilota bacterium]
MAVWLSWPVALALFLSVASHAQQFVLPTPNTAIYGPNRGEERYFVGTVGRPWTAGTFGCVRTGGAQMHEGIDIRAVSRDKRGEPTDPIFSTADGTVAYVNANAGLSNYGKYIIIRHQLEGLDLYSMYAHLSAVHVGVGARVKAGQTIGVMGRTSNTRQGISKERAHVHFELTLMINERFPAWHKANLRGQRNDHGVWNGRNFLGLDPTEVLLAQKREGKNFSILKFIRSQPELCRVFVPDSSFPWLKRYTPLIKRNVRAEREGVAGYEIALNYNGVPFQLIPRARSELRGGATLRLLHVNAAEADEHPCRKLVLRRSGEWQLSNATRELLGLLTY